MMEDLLSFFNSRPWCKRKGRSRGGGWSPQAMEEEEEAKGMRQLLQHLLLSWDKEV